MFARESTKKARFGVSLVTALAVGCGGAGALSEDDDHLGPDGDKADTSVLATVLDFEWDGELVSDWIGDAKVVVEDQLLFTIGHLNGNKSVGRLDRLQVSNTQVSDLPDGKKRLRYHAKMPVAWGSKTNLPRTYDFILPLDTVPDVLAGIEFLKEGLNGVRQRGCHLALCDGIDLVPVPARNTADLL